MKKPYRKELTASQAKTIAELDQLVNAYRDANRNNFFKNMSNTREKLLIYSCYCYELPLATFDFTVEQDFYETSIYRKCAASIDDEVIVKFECEKCGMVKMQRCIVPLRDHRIWTRDAYAARHDPDQKI